VATGAGTFQTAPAQNKGKPWLLVVIVGAAMLVAGGAAAYFIMGGKGDKGSGASSGSGDTPLAVAKKTVPSGDKNEEPALAQTAPTPAPSTGDAPETPTAPETPAPSPTPAPKTQEPAAAVETPAEPAPDKRRPQQRKTTAAAKPAGDRHAAPKRAAKPRGPKILLQSTPSGADVYSGGRRVGKTPLSLSTEMSLRLTIKKAGHYPLNANVVAGAKGPKSVRLKTIPMHYQARTFSELKGWYASGKITRFQHRMGKRMLADKRDKKLDALKAQYRAGQMPRAVYRHRLKQIKDAYR
jgi:hypothetical protein